MDTELSIDISRENNLKVLRIFDTSKYCEETIENLLLEVLPVNKSTWLTYRPLQGFSLALNSSSLKYKPASSTTQLVDLADGIYEFKISYKPNIETVSHFYHLRTIALRLKYLESLAQHFSTECKKNKDTYTKEVDLLNKILQYIDAAEYEVGDRHDKNTGISYYNRAIDLLKQFENECGCR